jgi:hypothetical protein
MEKPGEKIAFLLITGNIVDEISGPGKAQAGQGRVFMNG